MQKYNPLQLTTICFKCINTDIIQDLQSKYDLFKQFSDYSILIKWCYCDSCLKNITYCEECVIRDLITKDKFLYLCRNCEQVNNIKLSELSTSEYNDFFEFKIKMYCNQTNKYNYPHMIIYNRFYDAKIYYYTKNKITYDTFTHHKTEKGNVSLLCNIADTQFELSIILHK